MSKKKPSGIPAEVRPLISVPWWEALAIGAAAWVFFLLYVQFPINRNFDEFHYVPAALEWMQGKVVRNWEHPPLAKQLMTIGLALFGDRPMGWRFMSTLFGAVTLVGIYLWSMSLFRDRKAAWISVFLAITGQLLYVQARIGMLDTFMMGFMSIGLWLVTDALDPDTRTLADIRRRLLFGGISFGLAVCCKWFAAVPLATLLALTVYFHRAKRLSWPWRWIPLYLGVVPVLAYYVPFLAFFFVDRGQPTGLGDILTTMQTTMLDGQKRVVASHPYMSDWWTWPVMKRPIWYAFDREGEGWVRGVILIGNPLLMWSGLIAVLGVLWHGLRQKSFVDLFLTLSYLAWTFSWVAIPRKVAFYYYYYPSGILLGLVVTRAIQILQRKYPKTESLTWVYLGGCLALFVYFFPILAGFKIPADSFRKWMWFNSWI